MSDAVFLSFLKRDLVIYLLVSLETTRLSAGSLSSNRDVKFPSYGVSMCSTVATGMLDGSCRQGGTPFQRVENLDEENHRIISNSLPSVSFINGTVRRFPGADRLPKALSNLDEENSSRCPSPTFAILKSRHSRVTAYTACCEDFES